MATTATFQSDATAAASLAFRQAILPHLDAAYNLARWLVREPAMAEDVVQEACLRAFQRFATFRGDSGRAWLLQIVRNAAFGMTPSQRRESPQVE